MIPLSFCIYVASLGVGVFDDPVLYPGVWVGFVIVFFLVQSLQKYSVLSWYVIYVRTDESSSINAQYGLFHLMKFHRIGLLR